jgi:hypothetical protein
MLYYAYICYNEALLSPIQAASHIVLPPAICDFVFLSVRSKYRPLQQNNLLLQIVEHFAWPLRYKYY